MRAFLVTHTHWDREWYRTFQAFRARLVDAVDRVLDLCTADPGYRFLLDRQTVALEDYASIRPGHVAELRARVGEGRIAIGPWYVQPDSLLPAGEAHIRNLLEGRRDAARCVGVVRHEKPGADECIQLPCIELQRGRLGNDPVHDGEEISVEGLDLRVMADFKAVLDGQGVKTEDLAQELPPLLGVAWQEHKSGWNPEDFDGSWNVYACEKFHEADNLGGKRENPLGALWALKTFSENELESGVKLRRKRNIYNLISLAMDVNRDYVIKLIIRFLNAVLKVKKSRIVNRVYLKFASK